MNDIKFDVGTTFRWSGDDEIQKVTFVTDDEYYCMIEGSDGSKDILTTSTLDDMYEHGKVVLTSLMIEKVSWLLDTHYNLFHSDMICRAMQDDDVSLKDFITGCVAIHESEKNTDDDEFTPKEFENV